VVAALVVLGVAVALVVSLSAPSPSSYANETYSPPSPDLSPPPLPKVMTAEEATRTITADAVYGQSITAPTKCALPPIDVVTAAPEELEPYLNLVVGCLMAVWVDPMTAAGHELPRPPVIVYTEPITTGCGKVTMRNAFYCPADQAIYYAIDIMDDLPANLLHARLIDETTIAHEFGHAIQARTGIMNGAAALQSQAATPPRRRPSLGARSFRRTASRACSSARSGSTPPSPRTISTSSLRAHGSSATTPWQGSRPTTTARARTAGTGRSSAWPRPRSAPATRGWRPRTWCPDRTVGRLLSR
jgi:hypothetical protein